MLDYTTGLNKIVKKRISEARDYIETLRTIKGADPREVWQVFKKHGGHYSGKKIGIKNSYPEFPEPHPAYSQWRIAPESTERILEKINLKNYPDIAFLGCPILGFQFSRKGRKSLLLDVDVSTLNNSIGGNNSVQVYDVDNEPGLLLANRFDCVVCDPPWYDDEMRLFTKRAAQLVREGGTIYTSSYGILTKPKAVTERLDFQAWLTESKLVLEEIENIVEYEVPGFEYNAYQDIPGFTGVRWRFGDLLKLKKLEDVEIKAEIPRRIKWREYEFGEKRVFLRERSTGGRAKIRSVNADGSLILKTVSKRTPLIDKIDIWTSRNAVLEIVSGFNDIKNAFETKSVKGLEDKVAEQLKELIAI